jgi:hypothetical protein
MGDNSALEGIIYDLILLYQIKRSTKFMIDDGNSHLRQLSDLGQATYSFYHP